MKTFFRKLIYFVLPLVPVSIAADYYISQKLKNRPSSGSEYEVWNDIYSKNICADIAIYGSSRAWVHIDPKQFKERLDLEAYNFGIDNQNFHIQHLRHQKYFKNNPRPKFLILAIDEHSLGVREDLYNKNQFLPYMLWDMNIWKETRNYNGFKNLDYFIPLIRYSGERGIILEAFKNTNKKKLRRNGYRGIEQSWNNDLKLAKNTKPNYKIEIDPNVVLLLENFIKEIKKEDIKIIFVNTPQFIEGQKFVKNRSEILNIISSLALKNNIPFLDYSNDPLCYNRKNFYNSLHLNKLGSDLFTKKFILDLVEKEILIEHP